MKQLILLISVLILTLPVLSQNEVEKQLSPKNSVYMEFYGNSGYSITLNFERLFNKSNNFGIRAGFGILPPSFIYSDYFSYGSVPIEFLYLVGKKIHHIEFGIGASYLFMFGSKQEGPDNSTINRYWDSYAIISRIGYRYKGSKGLILRAGLTPIIDIRQVFFDNGYRPNLFGGVSIGYAF